MGALRDIHLNAAEKDSAVIFWRADSNTDMRFVGNFAAPLYKSNLFKDLVSSKRTTLHFSLFQFRKWKQINVYNGYHTFIQHKIEQGKDGC